MTARGSDLTPDLLLAAYRAGVFPMAERRNDDAVFWVSPERRGIFPLGGFRISRSLRRTLRSGRFTVTADLAFGAVVEGCADRTETWINGPLAEVYGRLHALRRAHSVEVWQDGTLAGGVFGVTLGAAFFGESMFSRRTDASKVALACLVCRLRAGGFRLFDTQFLTPHLASLGAVEIPRQAYLARLADAVDHPAEFGPPGPLPPGQMPLQPRTQTS